MSIEKKESKDVPSNFIRAIVEDDVKNNKHGGRVATRFPPEPNGYLHIGHAKAICVDFGIASDYNGTCNLRFDDTNPVKEGTQYVESIKEDVHWLGFDWGERLFYASDYFERLYDFAVELIKKDRAYICELNEDEIRKYRGTLTEPGQNSPYRERPTEESLDIFSRMRKGQFKEGKYVLRAKIDMSSPNIPMRDPVIYRIRYAHHIRTGDKWCIYPMYDFTHCLSDSLEDITHSFCSLEFENHRPLYEWFLNTLEVKNRPRQIEFARLNINHTVLSKRKLISLVEEGYVSGWDDPRLPTISGMRRRGYTANSIKSFCDMVGVGKVDSRIDMSMLEYCVREDLNENAPRAMTVLNPLKVIIENYPENQVEEVTASNHPSRQDLGSRKIPFSKIIYIENDDFMETPSKKYFRLSPGVEVRLKYAYYITCKKVIKDSLGNIIELHCTYDPKTIGGSSPDGRKVKGTIHWVSEKHAKDGDIRLYDRLFTEQNPDSLENFMTCINKDSIRVIKKAKIEPSLMSSNPGDRFQFERIGYFCVDSESSPSKIIFNRIVTLKDTWAKIEGRQ